jgi:S1-C subfamily serine protease
MLLTLALSLGMTRLGPTTLNAEQQADTQSKLNPAKMFSSLALLGDPKAGHGSGVFIKRNQIVTAKHVAVMLTYGDYVYDWKARRYEIERVELSNDNDIAIVTIKQDANKDVTPATFVCSLPAVLEPVIAVGHPLQMKSIMTVGYVNGVQDTRADDTEKEDGGFRVVTSLTAGPGMSGGPVFNQNGEAFGILVSVALASNGSQPGDLDTFNTGFTYILPFSSTPELCRAPEGVS